MAAEPSEAEAAYRLGMLALEAGHHDDAIPLFARAVALAPEQDRAAVATGALMARARRLVVQGRLDEAAPLLQDAARLQPGVVQVHANLGLVLGALGRTREAAASYLQALAIDGAAETHHALGTTLLRGGMLEEAIASFRKAAETRPDHAPYRSDVVFHTHFHPGYGARAILEEARAWDRAHAAALEERARPPPRRERAPDGRLRVGYVSPNFRQHCQAFFLFPLLRHHDRRHFEVFCYSDVLRPDEWTRGLLDVAERTRGIAGVSDEAVAEQIRADGIDVLVDLTMHMEGSRLLVFARRPAPVQVCWLAYPGTTGLAAMDYRLTDPHLEAPEWDASIYSEATIRLPETFWCYDPLARDEGVSPLPARQAGHVRFGCLNNFLKVNEGTLALWARVMREVPDSKLTMLAPRGDPRDGTLGLFEAHGVGSERVDFVEYQPRTEYLATYRSIDVCLDTFPYGGHTTSLDAFWMGVPVVTLVGPTVVGRAGLSQATNLGLTELVARAPEEYVRIAVDLCGDLARLAGLRAGLRSRMERSPLMEAARFARGIEQAYVTMWERYERKSLP